MATEQFMYDIEVVRSLSDKELHQRLCESWEITNSKLEVWGLIQNASQAGERKLPTCLMDVKSLKNSRFIDYPLRVRLGVDRGIFISFNSSEELFGFEDGTYISCELCLAPAREREKHENPFECNVIISSVQRLIELPEYTYKQLVKGEESIFLNEAVYKLHVHRSKNKIDSTLSNLKAEHQQQENKLNVQIAELDKNLQEKQHILDRHKNALQEIISKTQGMQQTKSDLDSKIEAYKKVEEHMSNKIEKLKSYILDKALFLKTFEFIDESDFDNFIFDVIKEPDNINMVSFYDVFGGDYKQAVSYIQAYLKEKDILYPRHIIENYLTLIRSNDLIILAGDSGSGKTNLVQSFAKAVGGVSKIIPVKPNWTSSEDLLGYYNPLEKKYLATPFLEALIEAQQHPEVPYFICLDEMNLARVEYYFADFLSNLEDRDKTPEIQLYSDDESAHVLSELKAVVAIITDAKTKYSQEGIVDFVKLMQDEAVNTEMKRAFGFSDKDSLIKYHGDIRRMLAGIIRTPSTIKIPANVRIIGAINIDETTHYLSPKILDRTHIMKFKSPLLTDWDEIFIEIETHGFEDVTKPLFMSVQALGERSVYPKFDRENDFCQLFVDLNREFFNPLDIEFGMRTIRQGLNYINLFLDVNSNQNLAMNNFILHKVLPKFTFDGNKASGALNKLELLEVLIHKLEELITDHESISSEFSSVEGLKTILENAKSNDGVVNYWA
ncbi:AAA family ATPase [Shewanella oncorhynchi]|uniref:McrB family protein n=1 Tax=Shewanella TaxID=22 RepID=UPI003D7BBB76